MALLEYHVVPSVMRGRSWGSGLPNSQRAAFGNSANGCMLCAPFQPRQVSAEKVEVPCLPPQYRQECKYTHMYAHNCTHTLYPIRVARGEEGGRR